MNQSPNRSLAISANQRNTRLQLCLLALVIVALAISLPVAAQDIQVPQPSPGLMPNPTAGKVLFEKNCASCHGAKLQGSDKGPPMLSKIYEPSHHGDAAFQLAVKSGSRAHHWQFGDMPPVPGLTPDDVAQITAYVRLEQRKAGIR
ncbi:Cytochrome C class I [Candidatus Accumulibacter aalborgensis]|uniref:Cytochrome C class I n=1 Tax=Candidatus Accumulibacter aalborgensis TaxID=1860102 RepID=A0A1A8XYJ3_9PROT|nr:cytochrome c [Candidatus Accumulibacter aalborgensis]SBT09123.1 Cytochrome C class I [Candidatus Accumulibacter aalborgensis]